MVKMFNNKKSSFDKINDYLVKKGHELVFSIYLADYNGNNIYIRFDYVPKIAVYKIVWVDLNFLNIKHLESYINVQMLTKFISTKIIEKLAEIDYESGFYLNDDIIGDRVELLTYLKENKEYVFDRFLPLEWEKFTSASAVPGINRNTVHKEVISLPDIETQDKIASVLKTLDDKIEINQKINDNLAD